MNSWFHGLDIIICTCHIFKYVVSICTIRYVLKYLSDIKNIYVDTIAIYIYIYIMCYQN